MTHIIQKKEPSPLEAFGEVEEGEAESPNPFF